MCSSSPSTTVTANVMLSQIYYHFAIFEIVLIADDEADLPTLLLCFTPLRIGPCLLLHLPLLSYFYCVTACKLLLICPATFDYFSIRLRH